VGRKKKSSTPRHKRMKQKARLQSAKTWITQYSGKNIVRGYSKHYGVDFLNAVNELEILGIKTDSKYIHQLKIQLEHKKKLKEERKQRREMDDVSCPFDQDFNFYYIAGYTPNGFPFGITWEEHERIKEQEYYYIAGYDQDGGIFGLRWDEFLDSVKEEDVYERTEPDVGEDEIDLCMYFGEGNYF
jgi:hypothetical protein